MRPYTEWMARAKSALVLSRIDAREGIFLEDLCAQAQQAAEKALKGLSIFYGVEPEYTHNIRNIITALRKLTEVDSFIDEAAKLSKYAYATRYPGDFIEVSETEYKKNIEIATKTVEWVEIKIFEATLEGKK